MRGCEVADDSGTEGGADGEGSEVGVGRDRGTARGCVSGAAVVIMSQAISSIEVLGRTLREFAASLGPK